MIAPDRVGSRLSTPPAVSPPCQGGCPVVTPVQSYVSYIAQGRFAESLRAITAYNPFPSVCGRICTHPCEDECRRAQVDEAISIQALKRFVTDQVRADGAWIDKQDIAPANGKKVAVIGAGPAGMACAFDLARLGFAVTVFESQEKAGGMLRYGILDYRLPQEHLDKDLDYILSHGIELRTGLRLGTDVTVDSLMNDEGFDAVALTIGLSASRSLPIPGNHAEDVLLAVPFLKAVNEGRSVKLGERVLVVGGGNVAIDVARAARRSGGGQVLMCCLESRDEMPAHDYEVEDAKAEGIEVHCSRGPAEVKLNSDGTIIGLETKEVECVFDEQGRFNPSFHEDRKHLLECDTIILAIGQMSELDFCDGMGIERNERGQLIVDRATGMTTRNSVFAGGEVANGPGAAISAIAGGHKVAAQLARHLGVDNADGYLPPTLNTLGPLPAETAAFVRKERRAEMPKLDAATRIHGFGEVESGLSHFAAVREAQRCMNCAAGASVIGEKCTSCLTCVRVCPYEVPTISSDLRVAEMDSQKCQSCGICAAECPANAIEISLEIDRPGLELFGQLHTDVGGASSVDSASTEPVVGFYCGYGAYTNPSAAENLVTDIDGVQMVKVMCTGRLEQIDVLRAFESGAEQVFIVSCPDTACHNNHGSWRMHKRIGALQRILDEAGIGGDKLSSFPTLPGSEGFAPMVTALHAPKTVEVSS